MKLSASLALTIALLAPAVAQTVPRDAAIANREAWCECVMVGGECRVTNSDPKPAGTRLFTPAGVISGEAYNWIRAHGALMCKTGSQVCREDWTGERCRTFRGMFRDSPMVCVRPGAPRQQ